MLITTTTTINIKTTNEVCVAAPRNASCLFLDLSPGARSSYGEPTRTPQAPPLRTPKTDKPLDTFCWKKGVSGFLWRGF